MIQSSVPRLDRYEVRMLDPQLKEGWFSCMAADFGDAQEQAEYHHPGHRVFQITIVIDGESQ